jgi:hypothetical protein
VSEYQYYEFLALDRPLRTAEQAEIRALSTRPRITATSFTNEYHWGDFRGSPDELMRRYYDAHLYLANWGTHRVMFRLPRTLLDPEVAEQYCVDPQVSLSATHDHVILDMTPKPVGVLGRSVYSVGWSTSATLKPKTQSRILKQAGL